MKIYIIIVIYLIAINVISLIAMGSDKRRAIHREWRISEKNLFLFAILGGSIGALAGMKLFHHKTKHKQFVYGMPLLLILQIILGFLIFFRITHFIF